MKNNNLNKIKSTGFKSPDGYFESLDENILNKLEEEILLDKVASGFNVPKDYFETFEDTITAKTASQKEVKVISIFNKKAVIYISGVAAAILVLLNLSIFDKNPSFDTLETATVENYIIDESMSSYEIAALLESESFNEDEFIENPLHEDHIELYLIENADIEVLITE